MKTQRLLQIISAAGFQARPYSGKGMSGRQCVGVANANLTDLIRACDGFQEAAELVENNSTAPLGLGYIIYWPTADWPKE